MKRTIATGLKNAKTIATAITALTLFPAGAYADLIFEHGGHTYKLVESLASWHDADAAAQLMSLGGATGYLARIDSDAENEAVVEAVLSHLTSEQLSQSVAEDGSNAPFIWLGASDDVEGQWRWSNNGEQFWSGDFNGTAVSGQYSNWGVQPDNYGGSEDALAIGLSDWPDPFYDLGETGQWNDLDKSTPLYSLVEFEDVSDLKVTLDSPSNGNVYSGIGIVKGWAISSDGIEKVEAFVDGDLIFGVPYGDRREDVGNTFPEMQQSFESGFSSPLNFSRLTAGEHRLTVKVTDSFGTVKEKSSLFVVARFDKSFIGAGDGVELGWARDFSALGRSILIEGALIDGAFYDIKLTWRTASQNFELVKITKSQ